MQYLYARKKPILFIMNLKLIKTICNSPFKKCVVSKSFYPLAFMMKFIKQTDYQMTWTYIPDSLYTKNLGSYTFCSKETFHFITNTKNNKISKNYASNIQELVKKDLVNHRFILVIHFFLAY
jgi:hypothetical protein